MTAPPAPSVNHLKDTLDRFSAEQRIVAAVHLNELPAQGDVKVWLRGGATFWNEDHWFVAWGLLLARELGDDDIFRTIPENIRLIVAECGDTWREKFGSLPLRDAEGRGAVAITAFHGLLGDQLFGFFRTVDDFVTRAPGHGWLLGEERDLSDTLARVSDDELIAIWSARSQQPFR